MPFRNARSHRKETMKIGQVGFVTTLLAVSLLILSVGQIVNSSVKANSNAQNKATLPYFLEKGKTYHFYFAVSSPNNLQWLSGKVEKLDADAGWVNVSYYVSVKKGKTSENVLQNSWVNMSQVFQCFELTPNP